jgi:oxygen tolerance protein BatD
VQTHFYGNNVWVHARRLLWRAALLALLPASVMAAEPEILVEVSHKQVYEGQPVRYDVTLNHVENPSPPQLLGFDNFDIEAAGEQSLDSSQTTIINGRMTQTIRRGRQYRYQLTPRTTGTLTIPGPVAEIDGKRVVGPKRTIRVIPAENQDLVFMEVKSSHSAVYPMQPFMITLTVAVKELPPPLQAESPVAVQRQLRSRQPALQIPWINQLPDGLEPETDLNSWAKPLLSQQRHGFSINGLTTGSTSVFSFFGDQDAAAFLPEPRKVERPDKDGRQVGYWEYDFVRTFTARKIGPVSFGPASLKGIFVRKVDPQGRAGVEDVYALARPVKVDIKDVPAQGRPDSFTGAIGTFQWSARLEPVRAKVGDPMTLTLTLSGKGTLGSTSAPDLSALPEIADRFKVYEATEETKPNSARFTYSLRSRKPGNQDFPPIPLSYFDVDSEQFVTLRTDAIEIAIAEAQRLKADQIVSSAKGSAAGRQNVEIRGEGIFANVTDRAAFRDESVHAGSWLLFLLVLSGLYGVLALGTVEWRRLSADQGLRRRRGAVASARKRLRQSVEQFAAGQSGQGVDLIQDAFVHLIADVTDLPEAGLTPKDIRAQLNALEVEDALMDHVGSVLDRCDASRYGTSVQDQSLIDEAQQTLDALIQALKAQKRFR